MKLKPKTVHFGLLHIKNLIEFSFEKPTQLFLLLPLMARRCRKRVHVQMLDVTNFDKITSENCANLKKAIVRVNLIGQQMFLHNVKRFNTFQQNVTNLG